MKITEYDHLTQETIIRDATDAEIAQREIDAANAAAKQAELDAKAAQKAALLERLGITQEEAQILLG
jgi:hypothetical protein